MRKIQLMLTALIMFQFSCEFPEETNSPVVSEADYQVITDRFREMFQGALELTESTRLVTVSKLSEKHLTLKLEVKNISQAVTKQVESHIGGFPEIRNRVIYPLPPSYMFNNLDHKAIALDKIINQGNLFGEAQKMYIKSLSEQILKAESFEEGFGLIETFRNKVIQSVELENDDKYFLLELAAGSEVLLEYIKSGKAQEMQETVLANLPDVHPASRTKACSVEWRKVWLGGVVGLTTGAVSGAWAGATVGTVTLPVIGTATGAVGGAVFLGAAGFVTGVTSGIVTDLLGTCFRSSSLNQSYKSCDLAWEAFNQNKINELPSECFTIPLSIKKL